MPNKAMELGVDRRTVGKRRRRFPEDRPDGLPDGPRSGRPRTVGDDRVAHIIGLTPDPTPPIGRPARWPGRAAFRGPRSCAFGTPSGRSRSVRGPSGSPAIPHSRTISATSWTSTCRRRIRAPDRTPPVPPPPGHDRRGARSISRRPRPPGSTRSGAGSPNRHAKPRRGVHASARQPEADIRTFIERRNQNPKPFRRTKSADDILDAVKRFRHRVNHDYDANFNFM